MSIRRMWPRYLFARYTYDPGKGLDRALAWA